MWMETKTEMEEASRSRASLRRRVLNSLLMCTGDMEHLDKFMEGRKTFTANCYIFEHVLTPDLKIQFEM